MQLINWPCDIINGPTTWCTHEYVKKRLKNEQTRRSL